jgi:hypothetical protein
MKKSLLLMMAGIAAFTVLAHRVGGWRGVAVALILGSLMLLVRAVVRYERLRTELHAQPAPTGGNTALTLYLRGVAALASGDPQGAVATLAPIARSPNFREQSPGLQPAAAHVVAASLALQGDLKGARDWQQAEGTVSGLWLLTEAVTRVREGGRAEAAELLEAQWKSAEALHGSLVELLRCVRGYCMDERCAVLLTPELQGLTRDWPELRAYLQAP